MLTVLGCHLSPPSSTEVVVAPDGPWTLACPVFGILGDACVPVCSGLVPSVPPSAAACPRPHVHPRLTPSLCLSLVGTLRARQRMWPRSVPLGGPGPAGPPSVPQLFLLCTPSCGTEEAVALRPSRLVEAQVLPPVQSQMHPEAGLSLLHADLLHGEGCGPCSETHLSHVLAFFSLCLFLINCCWSTVALQCGGSFCVQQSEPAVHTFSSCLGPHRARIPWAKGRFSSVICIHTAQ